MQNSLSDTGRESLYVYTLRARSVGALTTARERKLLIEYLSPNGWRGQLKQLACLHTPLMTKAFLRRLSPTDLPISGNEILTLAEMIPELRRPGYYLWLLPPAYQEQTKFNILLLDQHGLPKEHLRFAFAPFPLLYPTLEAGTRTGAQFPLVKARYTMGPWHITHEVALQVGMSRPYSPTQPELDALVLDINDALGATPTQTAFPQHGDLTPWNLRLTTQKKPALIDWEAAGYGPEHSDYVRMLATSKSALNPRWLTKPNLQPAIEFWLKKTDAEIPAGAHAWAHKEGLRQRERLRRLSEMVSS